MSYFRSAGSHMTLLKVSDMERLLDTRQSELIELNTLKKELDKKADRRARVALTLGSSIFIA